MATERYSYSAARLLMCLLLTLSTSLIACASSPSAPATTKANFNGGWSVKWCDKTNPKLDCGGFNITLIQEGDRICGDFGGALVNLRQIDEGTIVGTVVGNTAVLAVESMRNQSVVLVRAERRGNALHWRFVDDIKRGGNDIDIIASNSVLIKNSKTLSLSKPRLKVGQTCDSYLR